MENVDYHNLDSGHRAGVPPTKLTYFLPTQKKHSLVVLFDAFR